MGATECNAGLVNCFVGEFVILCIGFCYGWFSTTVPALQCGIRSCHDVENPCDAFCLFWFGMFQIYSLDTWGRAMQREINQPMIIYNKINLGNVFLFTPPMIIFMIIYDYLWLLIVELLHEWSFYTLYTESLVKGCNCLQHCVIYT